MDKEEVLHFLNHHPIFSLATVEGDTPHVRSMTVYKIDNGKVIFHTNKTRPVCGQLALNPKVELCFCSARGDFEIRVSGIAEPVEDNNLKKEIDPIKYNDLSVYQVKNAVATGWAMFTDYRTRESVKL
jgi:uncharacterized pyridoxamine 5'-phosphate oxidase family protein